MLHVLDSMLKVKVCRNALGGHVEWAEESISRFRRMPMPVNLKIGQIDSSAAERVKAQCDARNSSNNHALLAKMKRRVLDNPEHKISQMIHVSSLVSKETNFHKSQLIFTFYQHSAN